MITRRSFIKSVSGVAGAVGALAPTALGAGGEVRSSAHSSGRRTRARFPRSVLPRRPSSIRREIQEFVDQIPIIDTHEHLLSEPRLLKDATAEPDFMQLFLNYFPQDIIAAGMPEEEWNSMYETRMPTDKKWKMIEPYLPKAKNTGYYWAIDLAIRYYYGIDGLSSSTYRDLSEKIQQEYKPGIYQRILREAAGIDKAIVDPCDCQVAEDFTDRSILIPATQVDPWIRMSGKGDLENLSKESNVHVTTVSAIHNAVGSMIGTWHKRGIVAGKCCLAYDRTLEFKFVSDNDAQRALDTLWRSDDSNAARVLQDFIFHVVVQVLTDYDIPLQIHTGLLGQSNFGNLAQTHPMLLADVFAYYTKTRFDVFHAGFPWMRELGTLGRINTSVWADMCWAQFISPVAAASALDEWLDSMPASKILAFGGDFWFPEGSYGHSVIARTNVGEVLAQRVERRRMTMDEARQVAQMIFRDNAIGLFNLEMPHQ